MTELTPSGGNSRKRGAFPSLYADDDPHGRTVGGRKKQAPGKEEARDTKELMALRIHRGTRRDARHAGNRLRSGAR